MLTVHDAFYVLASPIIAVGSGLVGRQRGRRERDAEVAKANADAEKSAADAKKSTADAGLVGVTSMQNIINTVTAELDRCERLRAEAAQRITALEQRAESMEHAHALERIDTNGLIADLAMKLAAVQKGSGAHAD